MKTRPVIAILPLLAALLCSAAARAQAVPPKGELCMACHSLTGKSMGPSFKAVAGRYAGRPEALELLVQKVRKGTGGAPPRTPQWGSLPMPALTQLSDAEARTLVQWALSQK